GEVGCDGFWQVERSCYLSHISSPFSFVCVFSVLSTRWNCPAINYKFAAGNGGSSVRCQKGDEFCDFIRPVRTTQGNTAEHVHELFPGLCVVAFVLVRHSLDHSCGSIGFNEAGRNCNDANPFGTDFVRKGLAVIGACCLRG